MRPPVGTELSESDWPLETRLPAHAGILANALIVELYRLPGPITTRLKLHLAAKVANEGGWRGYRGGRQRLAGWCGVYTEWLAPGDGWTFAPLVGAGHTWPSWTDGEVRFADVLAPGDRQTLDIEGLVELARHLLADGDVDAVRVLTVTAPLASRVFTAGGPVNGVALTESGLSFHEAA